LVKIFRVIFKMLLFCRSLYLHNINITKKVGGKGKGVEVQAAGRPHSSNNKVGGQTGYQKNWKFYATQSRNRGDLAAPI